MMFECLTANLVSAHTGSIRSTRKPGEISGAPWVRSKATTWTRAAAEEEKSTVRTNRVAILGLSLHPLGPGIQAIRRAIRRDRHGRAKWAFPSLPRIRCMPCETQSV